MALGTRTVATLVVVLAVVVYYAMIPVGPNIQGFGDGVKLRLGAFVTDTTELLRALPSKAHIHWFNFNTWYGTGPLISDPSVKYTDMRIDGGVRIRLYEPVKHKARRAGLVYIHGGGWVYGNTKAYHGLTHYLSAELDAVVVSVDYRLSWQHPFPASLNDCTRATTWFLQHAKDYNVDPRRIAVAGDSAGGNMAAAVAGRLTFNKEYQTLPKLKFQGLIYPSLQFLDLNTPSFQQNADKYSPLLSKKGAAYYLSNYLTGTSDLMGPMLHNNHTTPEIKRSVAKLISHDLIPESFKKEGYTPPRSIDFGDKDVFDKIADVLINPDSSPLLRENLRGLPSAYIVTAEYDPIRDDGIMYTRRLEDAGVPVTWKHYEDGIHAMFSLFSEPLHLESGKLCMKDFIKYTKKALLR